LAVFPVVWALGISRDTTTLSSRLFSACVPFLQRPNRLACSPCSCQVSLCFLHQTVLPLTERFPLFFPRFFFIGCFPLLLIFFDLRSLSFAPSLFGVRTDSDSQQNFFILPPGLYSLLETHFLVTSPPPFLSFFSSLLAAFYLSPFFFFPRPYPSLFCAFDLRPAFEAEI